MARRRKIDPEQEAALQAQQAAAIDSENLDSEPSEGPGRGRTRSLGIPLTDAGQINWEHPKTRERVAQVLREPGVQEKAGVDAVAGWDKGHVAYLVQIIGGFQFAVAKTALKCHDEVARCFAFTDAEARQIAEPGALVLDKYFPGGMDSKPEIMLALAYIGVMAGKYQQASAKAKEIAERAPDVKPNGRAHESIQ